MAPRKRGAAASSPEGAVSDALIHFGAAAAQVVLLVLVAIWWSVLAST